MLDESTCAFPKWPSRERLSVKRAVLVCHSQPIVEPTASSPANRPFGDHFNGRAEHSLPPLLRPMHVANKKGKRPFVVLFCVVVKINRKTKCGWIFLHNLCAQSERLATGRRFHEQNALLFQRIWPRMKKQMHNPKALLKGIQQLTATANSYS